MSTTTCGYCGTELDELGNCPADPFGPANQEDGDE
jgi:hypothetical protein